MFIWKKKESGKELPANSQEYQRVFNEIVALNAKIETVIARQNTMEDTLKKFRSRVYREQQAEQEAEDSNMAPGILLPNEPVRNPR